MHPRAALIGAIAATSVAVGLVALDLVWNVEVRIDAMEDGQWQTIAEDDGDGYYGRGPLRPGDGCVSGTIRVVVENDRPVGARPHVLVTITHGQGAREVLLDDTWALDRFASRSFEFGVPPLPSPQDGTFYYGDVVVQVGDTYLSVCRGSA